MLMLLAVTSGCTSITVTSGEGSVSVERRFGLATISVTPAEQPMLVETRAIGFVNAALGFGAGYVTERLALLPPECRLVIWADEGTNLEAWRALLADTPDVCSLQPRAVD